MGGKLRVLTRKLDGYEELPYGVIKIYQFHGCLTHGCLCLKAEIFPPANIQTKSGNVTQKNFQLNFIIKDFN
jgi:hypothetical protein